MTCRVLYILNCNCEFTHPTLKKMMMRRRVALWFMFLVTIVAGNFLQKEHCNPQKFPAKECFEMCLLGDFHGMRNCVVCYARNVKPKDPCWTPCLEQVENAVTCQTNLIDKIFKIVQIIFIGIFSVTAVIFYSVCAKKNAFNIQVKNH